MSVLILIFLLSFSVLEHNVANFLWFIYEYDYKKGIIIWYNNYIKK